MNRFEEFYSLVNGEVLVNLLKEPFISLLNLSSQPSKTKPRKKTLTIPTFIHLNQHFQENLITDYDQSYRAS